MSDNNQQQDNNNQQEEENKQQEQEKNNQQEEENKQENNNNNNEVSIEDTNEGVTIKNANNNNLNMKANQNKANQPEAGKIDVSDDSEELDNKTKAEILSKIGHHKKQDCFVVYGENDKEKTLNKESGMLGKHTVYFKNCKDGTYTIADKCVKVFAESCTNLKVTVEGQLYTETVEFWNCENVILNCATSIKTLQLDQIKGVDVTFEDKNNFDRIIWAGLEDFKLTVGNLTHSSSLEDVKQEFPNVRADIDQFIVRIINNKLLQEKIIRLSNGYPTTQRESEAFDEKKEKNDKAYENYVRQLMNQKSSKIAGSLSKLQQEKPKKIGRNSPCICGSGKKYKKCCENKKNNNN